MNDKTADDAAAPKRPQKTERFPLLKFSTLGADAFPGCIRQHMTGAAKSCSRGGSGVGNCIPAILLYGSATATKTLFS